MDLKEIEEFLKVMRVRKNSHLHDILTTIFSGGKGCTLRQKNKGGWYNHSEDVLDNKRTPFHLRGSEMDVENLRKYIKGKQEMKISTLFKIP